MNIQDALTLLVPIIAAHIVVLVVIIFVIKRLLLSDTMHAVNRIREVEGEVRKKEEGIRREIAEHEREFEKKKAEAEQELQHKREESEKEIATVREQITAEAKKEGDRIIEQAKNNEAKLKESLVRDMETKAVEYGGEVFSLVFSDRINEEINKQFTGELLDALDDVDASTITVNASDAEFVSSHPMDDGQKARLGAILKEKFGIELEINESVDPSLLAGLTLKLGSLEIDGSLRNRCEEAMAEIRKNVQV